MTQAEEAFALVKERGEIRSSAIAEMLDCTTANVHELLLPYTVRGELVSCDVEAGGERLKDYRIAASTKPQTFRIATSVRPPQPPRATSPIAPIAPIAKPEPTPQPKEAAPMSSVSDKCEAAFRKYGPMTTRELNQRVNAANLAAIVSQCAAAGRFAVLGGGRGTRIYGMPDQDAPKSDAGKDTPPRSLHKKRSGGGEPMPARKHKRKAVKSRKTRAAAIAKGRAAAAARRVAEAAAAGAARAASSAGAFRPAITHDGAITLSGAATPGELNRAEARVLVEFLQRVNTTGIRP